MRDNNSRTTIPESSSKCQEVATGGYGEHSGTNVSAVKCGVNAVEARILRGLADHFGRNHGKVPRKRYIKVRRVPLPTGW